MVNNTFAEKCVSFEQAKNLKEIGFDEPVLMKYIEDESGSIYQTMLTESPEDYKVDLAKWMDTGLNSVPVYAMAKKVNNNPNDKVFAAPTYEAVIEWTEREFGFRMGVSPDVMRPNTYTWIALYNRTDSGSGMGLSTKREAYDRLISRVISYIKDNSIDSPSIT